jgi:hypothetical protein
MMHGMLIHPAIHSDLASQIFMSGTGLLAGKKDFILAVNPLQSILMKKEYRILGAGVKGLTAAFRLAQAGNRVIVLEKESRVGGVCRSFLRKGQVLDLGPHLLWNQHKETRKLIKEIGIGEMVYRKKINHALYYNGRFYVYNRIVELLKLAPLSLKILKPMLEKRFSGEKTSGLQIITLIKAALVRGHEYYLRGGMQTIPNALVDRIKDLGGQIITRTADVTGDFIDCTPQGPFLHSLMFYFGLNKQLQKTWFEAIFPEEKYWFQRLSDPAELAPEKKHGTVIVADRYFKYLPSDISGEKEKCLESLNRVIPGFSKMIEWEETRKVLNAFPLIRSKNFVFAGIEKAVLAADQIVREIS